MSLHCMDLFCGAGGMSLGLRRSGFELAGGFEWNDTAGKTYQNNLAMNSAGKVAGFGKEQGDISALDFGLIQEQLSTQGIHRLDLLAGGPPCQGFSVAGRGKVASLDDDDRAFATDSRNDMVHHFCRAVETLRPRAVLMENVTGMLNLDGFNHADVVCQRLMDAGYSVRLTVLNAAWYGVPQNRERLFIMALAPGESVAGSHWFPSPVHEGRSWTSSIGRQMLEQAHFTDTSVLEKHWPGPECHPPVTVAMALDDLPSFTCHLDDPEYRASRELHDMMAYPDDVDPDSYAHQMRFWDDTCVSAGVSDHFCRNTPRDFRIFEQMEHGDRYPRAVEIAAQLYRDAVSNWDRTPGTPQPHHQDYIPPYPLGGFDERWQKLDPNRPSWTVTAHLSRDCYSHIHHDSDQARTISIREAARLQSFPDAYHFHGSMGDCYRQIGNAVPPLLARALGYSLKAHLEQTPVLKKTRVSGKIWRSSGTWSRIHKNS